MKMSAGLEGYTSTIVFVLFYTQLYPPRQNDSAHEARRLISGRVFLSVKLSRKWWRCVLGG
jgi:hypothetical protein